MRSQVLDRPNAKIAIQAFLGSLVIAICSLVWVPTLPVPTTMQPFALTLLALRQGPKLAFLSSLFYLVEASLGLPVLRGISNPLWLIGPTAGYLLAFPLASFVMASLIPRCSTLAAKLLSILLGHAIIYSLGFLHLIHFVGPYEAWKWGVLFFIPADGLKGLLAIAVSQRLK